MKGLAPCGDVVGGNREFYNPSFVASSLRHARDGFHDSSIERPTLSFFTDTTTLILIVAAIVSGSLLFWPMISRSRDAGVSATEAVRLINREKAIVIDVREPGEYAVAHVAGSRNVPLGRLEVAPELPKNKTRPVILVCATGKRAATAAKALTVKGYTQAVVLSGGIEAWKTANLPIESKPAA